MIKWAARELDGSNEHAWIFASRSMIPVLRWWHLKEYNFQINGVVYNHIKQQAEFREALEKEQVFERLRR